MSVQVIPQHENGSLQYLFLFQYNSINKNRWQTVINIIQTLLIIGETSI